MNTNDHLADDCSQSTERSDAAAPRKEMPPLPPMLREYNPPTDGDRAQLYPSDQMYAYGRECMEWERLRAASRDAEVRRLREALRYLDSLVGLGLSAHEFIRATLKEQP